MMITRIALRALGILMLSALAASAADLGTAFTYQGRLESGGTALTDTCTLTFSAWDAIAAGSQLASQTVPGVAVTDGLFTVSVDLGAGVFDGQARYLQIAVQCTGDGSPTTLSPRQPLTAAPYALALPALRTEATSGAPNVIGGAPTNTVSAGVGVTLIGGEANEASADYAVVGGGLRNQASGVESVIAGGEDNVASGFRASIGGGDENQATGDRSTISGGENNTAAGEQATIGGGVLNDIQSGPQNAIGGGASNLIGAGAVSAIGGGQLNRIDRSGGVIGGGNENHITDGAWSVIGGGSQNQVHDGYSTVSGGNLNVAGTNDGNELSSVCATVGGGQFNTASGVFSTIAGGQQCLAGGDYSMAGGRRAKVRNAAATGDADGDEGTFVWADSENADFQSTGPDQFLIRASGGVGIGTASPAAQLHAQQNNANTPAVLAIHDTPGADDTPAVDGINDAIDFWGIGVRGQGGYIGVNGSVTGTATGPYYGVRGIATAGNPGTAIAVYGASSNASNNYGVWGEADSSGPDENTGVFGIGRSGALNRGVHGLADSAGGATNIGVHGAAANGTENFAGLFEGDLHVDFGRFRVVKAEPAAGLVLANDELWTHGFGVQDFGNPSAPFVMATEDNGQFETAGIFGNGDHLTLWSAGDAAPGQAAALAYFLDEDSFNNDGDPYDDGALKAYITTMGSWMQASDRNRKQAIERVAGACDKVEQLSGYTYEYKPSEADVAKGPAPKRVAGLIAQEVLAVLPEAVDVNDDGEHFLDYSAVMPLLVESIKELRTELRQRDQAIAALEARLSALERGSAPRP